MAIRLNQVLHTVVCGTGFVDDYKCKNLGYVTAQLWSGRSMW